jgi:hypothetical protein
VLRKKNHSAGTEKTGLPPGAGSGKPGTWRIFVQREKVSVERSGNYAQYFITKQASSFQ